MSQKTKMRLSLLLTLSTFGIALPSPAMAVSPQQRSCHELQTEAYHHMAWQWGDGGYEKTCGACDDALMIYLFGFTTSSHTWDDIFRLITTAGRAAAGDVTAIPDWVVNGKRYDPDPGAAYRKVKEGQRHNEAVQDLYAQLEGQCGGADAFMERFVSASKLGATDWGRVRSDLEWQVDNNPESMDLAINAWRKHNGHVRGRILAMYWLLQGQRHNDAAMTVLRAAYRDSRSNLFKVVASVMEAKGGYAKAEQRRREREQRRVDKPEGVGGRPGRDN